MVNRGEFDKVGCQIGVGKESVAYDMHCVIMSLVQGHPLHEEYILQSPHKQSYFWDFLYCAFFLTLNYYEEDSEEENQQNSEAGQTNAPETHDAFDKEEDNQTMITKDTDLKRRLRNQNRHVIESMGGGWKTHGSRSTNKDKGHRSSHNSKIQKQLRSW